VLNLAHSEQDVRDSVRRVEANKLNGIDAEWVGPDEIAKICPIVNLSTDIRYPVLGATFQPRGGIAKHDYVGWGFARRADEAGIDLIQGCEVTGFVVDGNQVSAVQTSRGTIGAGRVLLCAAGNTTTLTDMLGLKTPIQSHPLQAVVSELLEPVHPTVVMSNAVHVYVSQAHKGELVVPLRFLPRPSSIASDHFLAGRRSTCRSMWRRENGASPTHQMRCSARKSCTRASRSTGTTAWRHDHC
jgi:sarcosine oxidase subunit beta